MSKLVVKVLDSYYGYPVEGAQVIIEADNFTRTKISGSEGAVFEDLRPGEYTIQVRDLYSSRIPYKGKIYLSSEDKVKVIEVKLLRPIEVTVKDPRGNPVNKATVRMVYLTTPYDALYDHLVPFSEEVEVDKEGRVELLPVGGGDIRIDVYAPGYRQESITIPFFDTDKRITLNITLKPKQKA